jgi:hypothetical protein
MKSYIKLVFCLSLLLIIYACGTSEGQQVELDKAVFKKQASVDEFVGTNAFIDDPLEVMQVAGGVREYHDWSWNEGNGEAGYPGYPNSQIEFNLWGGYWDFDAYYKKLGDAGIFVFPCIQGGTNWIGAGTRGKPYLKGFETTDPAAYEAHGSFMYQYAARYGNVKVPIENLKLKEGQKPLTGLGTLEYYENWNEPDCWWMTHEHEFSPIEFAAMSSADRDGHMGQLGKNIGIKNADPNAKLVMGGIAKLDIEYVKGMKNWCDEHRNGDFVFDVLNFHHYSRVEPGRYTQRKGVGISPEDDKLYDKLAPLVQWTHQNLPGKEVWLTEFGYDTNPQSIQAAQSFGSFSIYDVQAIWLLRSIMISMSAGIHKSFMFMLRDVNPSDPTQYSTSGLVGPKDDWTPKTSWYYLYAFRNLLKGMHFNAIHKDENNRQVYIHEYVDRSSGKKVYAVWLGTSEDKKIENYQFPLEIPKSEIQLAKLQKKETVCTLQTITQSNGKINLSISETPVFIIIN